MVLKQEDNWMLTSTNPGTEMGELFRRFWMPALLSEEIPAPDTGPVRVTMLGENLVAFRDSDGEVGLVNEACPHRTASLYFGRNEEGGLRCVYHGWKFDRNGTCLEMPNEPTEARFKDRVRLRSYPTHEANGVIWAYMGPEEDQPEVPRFEWMELPPSHIFVGKVEVGCNYMQSLEGDIDPSHISFLHQRIDGQVDRGSSREVRAGENLRRFTVTDTAPKYFCVDTEYGFMVGTRRDAGTDHYYWRVTPWFYPAGSLIPREAGTLQTCLLRVPLDDERHHLFGVYYRPDAPLTEKERYEFQHGGNLFQATIPGTYKPTQTIENDFLRDRSEQRAGSYTGVKGIAPQDQAVTVTMGRVADRTKERLGTSDTAIIYARRSLLREAKSLAKGSPITPSRRRDSYFLRGVAMLLPRDEPFDVAALEAMDANGPWNRDVPWAQVQAVGEGASGT